MATSRADKLYRNLLVTKFFTRGWGKPEDLKRIIKLRKTISNREQCSKLVPSNYPVTIHKESVAAGCRILDGSFQSPFVHVLPGVMPREVETARFQVVLPLTWTNRQSRPICLQLAGTGDHGFWLRRTFIARPLIAEAGIASVILENPYYGVRKPRQQLRSSLQNVIDLFVMGGALVLESAALLHWCRRQGLGPLGITGVSMGGHMASLAASNWPEPISLVPCLSWSTASSVWTQGVFNDAVSWGRLQQEYNAQPAYANDVARLLTTNQWIDREKAARLHLGSGLHHQATDPRKGFTDRLLKLKRLPALAGVTAGSTAAAAASTDAAASLGGTASAAGFGPALPRDRTLAELGATESRGSSLLQPRQWWPSWPIRPQRSAEVVEFMRGLMDECTHLSHYSVPVDPSLAVIVSARHDGYVPRSGVTGLDELWPGCRVRFVERGHVAAALFCHSEFRSAIIDSFELQESKYSLSATS